MKTGKLESMGSIKDSVSASDVPEGDEIVDSDGDALICEETVEVVVGKEKVGTRTDPSGNYEYPIYEKITENQTRRYRLEPRRQGLTRKNYDFEESEAEREARERARVQEGFADKLAEMAAQRGVTPAEMIERLFGDDEPEGLEGPENGEPERKVPSVTVDGLTAEMTSPGTWTMPDGETVDGKKSDAREYLEGLLEG